MGVSKDVIKQCLISKQREVDEALIVNRPVEFEENGNYVKVGLLITYDEEGTEEGISVVLVWK